jgi:flagellar FliL protein
MAEETGQQQPEQPAAAAAETPPAKGRGKLLIVAGAVVVLAGGGAAVWRLGLLSHGAPAEAKEDAKDEKPAVGALLPLDPFIANLADEDGKRYLKATLQVEFFASQVPPEFNARMPQMRDLLLTLFTNKLFSEIRTPQGKALLRDEIINRMNRTLNKDMVKAVYFTEFIVQ